MNHVVSLDADGHLVYKGLLTSREIATIDEILNALKDEPSVAGSNFINALAKIMLQIAKKQNLEVVLSGGVFQNATLLNLVVQKFSEGGVKFHLHKNTPSNDSGVALGQLMAYLSALNKNLKK